jgi:hypothetical protein
LLKAVMCVHSTSVATESARQQSSLSNAFDSAYSVLCALRARYCSACCQEAWQALIGIGIMSCRC